ncbi:MAG: 50S ribosomal protein L37e [Candidatus Woesearchaeota archaeon]|jgi:large subunit ribosomal protein L37e|nr:50S ribosomal protein L37e [Candidatus Woesearchaeota archaeon]
MATGPMGKKSGKKTHIRCRRCGNATYHRRHNKCSSCGYGKSAKMRSYAWMKKKLVTHLK